MELWCFLHCFQSSKYKYFYLTRMIETLKSRSMPIRDVSDLEKIFFQDWEGETSWWYQLIDESIELMVSEKKIAAHHSFQYSLLGDPEYPEMLMNISDPPLIISYQGPLELLNQKKCLSVVGAREPHELTKQWLRQEFYQFLKVNSVMTVSGGARGVDGIVHQLSLFLETPTAVILPSGLVHKYPAHWNQVSTHEQKNIVFISEMRHSTRIAKQNFACRNRIIAGLSTSTLILEAGLKSGTIITAHRALIENRNLLVVPAHPMLVGFEGSLELLVLGGKVVRNKEDLESHI